MTSHALIDQISLMNARAKRELFCPKIEYRPVLQFLWPTWKQFASGVAMSNHATSRRYCEQPFDVVDVRRCARTSALTRRCYFGNGPNIINSVVLTKIFNLLFDEICLKYCKLLFQLNQRIPCFRMSCHTFLVLLILRWWLQEGFSVLSNNANLPQGLQGSLLKMSSVLRFACQEIEHFLSTKKVLFGCVKTTSAVFKHNFVHIFPY